MIEKTKSATLPAGEGGRQYHIGLAPGEVSSYIILTGDPGRIDRVAGLLDEASAIISNREYRSVSGKYNGTWLTVVATGMGPDNTEMAVVELSQIVKNPAFIRLGTSGGLQEDIEIGEMIISTGAVRLENTSTYFVHEGYPALANHEVILALTESVQGQHTKFRLGITATASGFYGVQGRKVPGFPPRYDNIPGELAKMGVLNFEMETSTLFSLATLSGARAGSICTVIANRPKNTFIDAQFKSQCEEKLFSVGFQALHVLEKMDQLKTAKRVPHWLPSISLAQ
jgi:uridine phosphorylase